MNRLNCVIAKGLSVIGLLFYVLISCEKDAPEGCSEPPEALLYNYTSIERTDVYSTILPTSEQLLIDTASITSFTIYQNCHGQQLIDSSTIFTATDNYYVKDLPGDSLSSTASSHFRYYSDPTIWPNEITSYFVVSRSYQLANTAFYGHNLYLLFNEERDSMALVALDPSSSFQTIIGFK